MEKSYKVGKVNNPKPSLYFGVCDTAESVATKVVTINDLTAETLVAGTHITIYFTNANTVETPSINLNGIGTFNVVSFSGNRWSAGTIINFVYNNSQLYLIAPTTSLDDGAL